MKADAPEAEKLCRRLCRYLGLKIEITGPGAGPGEDSGIRISRLSEQGRGYSPGLLYGDWSEALFADGSAGGDVGLCVRLDSRRVDYKSWWFDFGGRFVGAGSLDELELKLSVAGV